MLPMLQVAFWRWPWSRRAKAASDSAAHPPAFAERCSRCFRWLWRQAVRCLAMIGLGTVVYCTCFNVSRVTSGSMSPTLQGTSWRDGDLVLTERLSYRFRAPRRWELVAFRNREGVQVMKRVIGLPGEQVQMLRGGRLLIDGEPLAVPDELAFLRYFPFGNLCNSQQAACGAGYYLLGDDSRDSDDSRFNGPLLPHEIIGRPWLILAPAARRGWVHGQQIPAEFRNGPKVSYDEQFD